MCGSDPIIAVDLDDAQLEFAKRFGATHGINAGREDPVAAIHAITAQEGAYTIFQQPVSGADYTFDCIGIKKTMEQIVPACRGGHFGAAHGGTAVLVGVPMTTMQLQALDLLLHEKRFVGSIGGSCVPDRDFPTFIGWFENGELDLDAMVTERFKLEDINTATDALEAGRISGRAILDFRG
jgi:Zn-dependent alcohol dehydrogenase